MVDVVPQVAWVLYRIKDKDKGDESLPLQAFRRKWLPIFLKYSKNADYIQVMLEFEISQQMFTMMTQNITRCNLIRCSEPLQTSKRVCFCVNSQQIKFVNWKRKNAPSQMIEWVLNTLLLKNKARARCAERTLDAVT